VIVRYAAGTLGLATAGGGVGAAAIARLIHENDDWLMFNAVLLEISLSMLRLYEDRLRRICYPRKFQLGRISAGGGDQIAHDGLGLPARFVHDVVLGIRSLMLHCALSGPVHRVELGMTPQDDVEAAVRPLCGGALVVYTSRLDLRVG
jgi:hypothetical protein